MNPSQMTDMAMGEGRRRRTNKRKVFTGRQFVCVCVCLCVCMCVWLCVCVRVYSCRVAWVVMPGHFVCICSDA